MLCCANRRYPASNPTAAVREKLVEESLSILIADDHSLVREGLKLALADLPAACEIVEAASAQEVLDTMSSTSKVDLIVLDLHMPGVNDLDLLKTLCNSYPDVPLVVVSADENPRTMQRVVEHGAVGFIPKSAAHNVLAGALQLVMSGGVYIPTQLLDRPATSALAAGMAATGNPRDVLTGRQMDVLELVAEGQPNKEIARRLGLSEHTVKIHLSAIFKTLGVSNRTEAAIACRELGLFGTE
jgi:two-component system nitrate/nitrite response regulator NarL